MSSSHDVPYWYNDIASAGVNSQMPPQAIPKSRKNEAWEHATMDALERIGLRQIRENQRFVDYYRMIDGKMSYQELSDVIPQLREVGDVMTDMSLPSFLKHYDILGIIINGLVGEFMQNRDKFSVTNVDEIATNEYQRDKAELFSKYVAEDFGIELKKRLASRGMNPDVEQVTFKSEEEKQEYIQQLEAMRQELTPPQIELYMNSKWKSIGAQWGENTLEADDEKFYQGDLDRKHVRDFLLTGRAFTHFRVGYDFYKPEYWSPLNTFFSEDIDTEHPQDGEYVGRIHLYSKNQIINNYGHKMSKRVKEKLLHNEYSSSPNNNEPTSFFSQLENNFHSNKIVPFEDYDAYNFTLGIQNLYGTPMGEFTDNGGSTQSRFFPERAFNPSPNAYSILESSRRDISVRRDLVPVVEAYWISYELVGYLTFMTPEGRMTSEIVTEDLLPGFLKDNGIKQVHTVSLEETEKNPQPNTIVWDYRPVCYKGVKIKTKGTYLDDDLYIDVGPCEFQIKGDSNVYDIKLPVAGIIDTPLADKIQPFQVGHNLAMNQAYNLMEKEIGMFFIFDVNFLPSEFKEWGDSEETLLHLRSLVKDVGMFPIDGSKQNVRDAGSFNQFSVQNLTYTNVIIEKLQLADMYKRQAFEQVGITPQRLGNPVKYETAEGVRQSQTASFAQTEVYADKFATCKQRQLELHLAVAQYAQEEGKDITLFQAKSDMTHAFLKVTDPMFKLRNLGILPVSNSKKRKELETFKNFIMQNNTMGADEMSLAEIFTSDTMVELMEHARNARMNAQKQTQEQRAHEGQLMERQKELEEQMIVEEWKREELSKQRDRENRILIEEIQAMGRAADKDADAASFDMISKTADLALRREDQENRHNLDQQRLELEKEKHNTERSDKFSNLKAQLEKIKLEREKMANQRYIAEINKN